MQARPRGEEEPRLLVSTDVLAEGHNLQLAETVVTYLAESGPSRWLKVVVVFEGSGGGRIITTSPRRKP